MCSCIDDADRTFEEESRRRNQHALSAWNGLALDLRASTLQSSIATGWRDKGDGLEDREREKSISEKVALGGLGGGRGWGKLRTLLISKRKGFLKLGCLAVLAAYATRGSRNEIWFSDELRGIIGTQRKSPHNHKKKILRHQCLLRILIYHRNFNFFMSSEDAEFTAL